MMILSLSYLYFHFLYLLLENLSAKLLFIDIVLCIIHCYVLTQQITVYDRNIILRDYKTGHRISI